MHPYPFAWHRASTVNEALKLLASEEDPKVLAGGQSLLSVMKLRLAQPATLIDISEITDLREIRLEDDALAIGALATHHDLETNPLIAKYAPLLAEIARTIGDQQVRNRGTIGGVLAHADPAADYPAGILALDATIVVQGKNGERRLPVNDFFQGFMTTALAENEIITMIRIPVEKKAGVNYQKLANPASGYAIVGVGAFVTKNNGGTIETLRLGMTGVGETAYRATAVEDALIGKNPTDEEIREATKHAVNGVTLLDDLHAPARYRHKVACNLTYRAITEALKRT